MVEIYFWCKKRVRLEVGNWFDDNLVKMAGNEVNYLFSLDLWWEGRLLCNKFIRFFELVDNRYVAMENMCSLGRVLRVKGGCCVKGSMFGRRRGWRNVVPCIIYF